MGSLENDLTITQDIFNVNYSNVPSYSKFLHDLKEELKLTASTRFDYNSRCVSTINQERELFTTVVRNSQQS